MGAHQPLKIAVWHNLPSGGGKRALHDHVAGLVRRGHRVEVWCPEVADETYLPLSDLTTVHRLPLRFRPSRARGFVKSWRDDGRRREAMERHSQRCAREIADGGFDVFLGAACRYYCVPYIIHCFPPRGAARPLPTALYLQEPNRSLYEALPELVWAVPPRRADLSPPRRILKRVANAVFVSGLRSAARREADDVRQFDLVLCNSFFSRESILRAYNQDARVCYLGVDSERFSPAPDPSAGQDSPYLIGLGSLQWSKGVDTAIRAIGCLPEPRPRLVWVANHVDQSYAESMRSLAAAEGVTLEIHQQITDAELVRWLRGARLMIYTSRLEPFGYAPLEANACGTPVVAVAEGGIRETVRHGVNGLLCDRQPEALAAAVVQVLADPDFGAALSRQSRAEVETRWTISQSDERLEAELARLVQQKSAPV